MSLRSITVYLDEPWYNALARQAKKEDMTVEEKLEDCLDALIEQLPERVRDRVSREVWEEHQREMEASRRCSVLRVTQNGRTDHLLTEDVASLDALHAAVRLRSFLLSKVGHPSLRFTEMLHGTVDIAPEAFQEHAEELRQGTEHVTAALDIDLDRSEFSMLDTEGGHWLKYAVPDVLSALWHSQRNPSLTSEQQQTIFDSRLDGLEIFTPEAPDMEEKTSPTMGLSM